MALVIRPLPLAAQRVMPWRNGGGTTREVAIEPATPGSTAPFRWRISCANVASDGPFSLFPGIDRTLWLGRGCGVELTFPDGRTARLDRVGQRLDFAGELAIAARLVAGPCEDANVFVDRATTAVDTAVIALPAGSRWCRRAAVGTTVLAALLGSVTITLDAHRLQLDTGDALRLDVTDASAPLLVHGDAALVLHAQFTAR
jgi:hypothetical protein